MSTRGICGTGASSTTTTNGRTPNPKRVGIAEEAVPVQPRANFATLCKHYITLGGKPFKWTKSIIGVQAWLQTYENIFKGLDLADERKRFLASWQLQEGAVARWDSLTTNVPEEEFFWKKIKEEFEVQFLPATGKTRIYRNFMDLKQGDLSVEEYENKFNELSCFGPELINTPLKKNKLFVTGLRESFHEKMMGHLKGSFVDLMDMALRYEALDKKKPVPAATSGNTSGNNPNKRKFNPN